MPWGPSDVEEQDVDLWRGFHDGPSYAIIVHKLGDTGESPDSCRRDLRRDGLSSRSPQRVKG